MTPPTSLAILGSTGSIGTQALEVVAAHPERFRVAVLTAGGNAERLIEQARHFQPEQVVIADENKRDRLAEGLRDLPIEVAAGEQALIEAASREDVELVLTALVGFAGLQPTLAALRQGKRIALANKETMVVAGELVNRLAAEHGAEIIPVDSEHSAIYQCLVGESAGSVEKLTLTASGGPFRGFSAEALARVEKAQALRHPNWSMGAKITIDSATMMNKGLEVIEARWLFDLPLEQIDIVVHPQSIIHSMVTFVDGSMKAQLGLPDMRVPIQYAMGLPDRLPSAFPRLHWADYPSLQFEAPDPSVFRAIPLTFAALEAGGNRPCILNAANEIAVEAFLNEQIRFPAIYDCIEAALATLPHEAAADLDTLLATDAATRQHVRTLTSPKHA